MKKELKKIAKYKWQYLFGIILAVVLCVFRIDTSTDSVLEMALTAVLHKGDFAYSPFTGEPMTTAAYWSPMTWVYTVLARVFDIHPVLIGKLLMPVVVMLLFITVWRMLFEQLLGENAQTQIALWILLGNSLMFCFSMPYDFTGLWVSPWTDRSIFTYVVFPLIGTVLLWTVRKILNNKQMNSQYKIEGDESQDSYLKIGKRGFIIFAFWGIVSVAVAIGFNGCIFFNSTYAFPDNRFKMDKEIMDIREMVEGVPEIKMLAPVEVAAQIRECDDKVKLVCAPDELADSLSIEEALEKYDDANIVVIPRVDANESLMYTLGYTKKGSTEGYEIYEFVSKNLGKYTVTQYASVTGSQSMIYTITDWEGHLIVVDGGWKEDTGQLLKCIKDNGGKVDAWIISHPHPDHSGGFNGVYASGVVEIGTIYTVPMDYEIYKSKAQPWDEFEIYNEFVDLTVGADNIVYLNEGDEIDLFGLKMEVFHSFDIDAQNDSDPCNAGSMIFKLSANHDSMLFLGDVPQRYDERVLEKWGDRLAADYVQMGHHGNAGMSEAVYQVINPKGAFFDAPESLMQSLDTPKKRALMESMGAEIFYYATAPNEIVLE